MSHPETCIRIRLIGHLLANLDYQPTRSGRPIYTLTNTNVRFLSQNCVHVSYWSTIINDMTYKLAFRFSQSACEFMSLWPHLTTRESHSHRVTES